MVGVELAAKDTLAPPDSVLDLLRELVAEVRGLRADLKATGNKDHRSVSFDSALSRADRALLARWLPAIGGAYGPEKFSSRDLAEDTRPAVRLVVRGLSVKAISKLFARAAGIPIDGLMVRRCDFEFGVMRWQIVAEGFKPVSNPATEAAPVAQSG